MSGETRDLFAGQPPAQEPHRPGKPKEPDWLEKTSRTGRDGWRLGFGQGLARAAELAMEQGDHGTVCRIIEEGARRFGDVFLSELADRGVNPEDLVDG